MNRTSMATQYLGSDGNWFPPLTTATRFLCIPLSNTKNEPESRYADFLLFAIIGPVFSCARKRSVQSRFFHLTGVGGFPRAADGAGDGVAPTPLGPPCMPGPGLGDGTCIPPLMPAGEGAPGILGLGDDAPPSPLNWLARMCIFCMSGACPEMPMPPRPDMPWWPPATLDCWCCNCIFWLNEVVCSSARARFMA